MIPNALNTIYLLALASLSVFGLLGLVTLWFYWLHRQETFDCPPISEQSLPSVTIQLPIFNERYVVERLIRAAVQLDYPPEKLQIQVLDDSTDDTTEIAAAFVEQFRRENVNIILEHRTHRQGYKAGALQEALQTASGDFIGVFDADFQPQPDFLSQTIPHFIENANMGMIQTRWGHLNLDETTLTGAQSIALDKHFTMEQTVRHRANLFPKFNGSAGIWRRECLEDAGGWEADTVCEDLCLSTRAVLNGWDFRFLNNVVSPAELPATISAYKNQQSRWAKGSTQCLFKFGPEILGSHQHSWIARIYAVLSMAGYTTHLLLLLLLLVQVPLVYLKQPPPPGLFIFGLAGIAQPLLFVLGQQVLYPDWKRRLLRLPSLLLIAVGLAPSNTRAILLATTHRDHPFIRTPKGFQNKPGQQSRPIRYQLPFDWIVLVEILLTAYSAFGLFLCFKQDNFGPLFFFLTCLLGFGYVAWLSIQERF